MTRLEKAAAFGAMMGKIAAEGAPTGMPPQPQRPMYTADTLPRGAPLDGVGYSARENDIYKSRQDLYRKGEQLRAATGGTGLGTSKGVIKGGVVQPGATFTPQAGQPLPPLPGAGGQMNTPPIPKGPQAPGGIMESKTPKRLF